jgi:hypothetical protein
MSHEEWGPLAGLIGTWESSFDGLDVAFHSEQGKIHETTYRERTTFTPFGPIDNGEHSDYGLDYRTSAWREGEESPFHTEVGYWMWSAATMQVTRCFVIPRAQALIAGATVEPTARSFRLEARIGSNTYGILSNQSIEDVAHSTRFDVTVTITEDTFSYDETTEIENQRHPSVIMHTDRNTLKRLSRES